MKMKALKTGGLEAFHFLRDFAQFCYNLLTNIGRKGYFMYSWVQINHIRWRALAMQMSSKPLQSYEKRKGVTQRGNDKGPRFLYQSHLKTSATYISLYLKYSSPIFTSNIQLS